jgi:hypothetical protein
MNHHRSVGNPIAAMKTGAARRERRHVRTAAKMYVPLQANVTICASGEVPEVLDMVANQNAAIPARPTARNTTPSRVIPIISSPF